MGDFIEVKLRDCLQQLINGKATDRKKQVDALKNYLTQAAYTQYLTRSSTLKRNAPNQPHHGSILITWKIVFHKIKSYLEQECRQLQERESSSSLSDAVRNNINKEKGKCLSLFRTFIKALHSNKQYDMAQPIMDHMLSIFQEHFTKVSFGLEYSNMLLKYILTDPFMCQQIPATTFDDAIWIYCKVIKNPPSGWDRTSLTQVLFHLLNTRLNIGIPNFSKLFKFFSSVFEAVRSERACGHHENLLKCLMLFCRSLNNDHRLQLCELGETILPPIMQLWKTRPSDSSQELMLEFISFQLTLHHPKGHATEDKGAVAHEWSCWKNLLLNLYKLIITEIMEICEKNKYSSGKETILKPVFISVTIEICAQVFGDSVGALDVTQSSFLNDGSLPSKKRRIDVCFRTLIESLSSSKIVPWLQIISAFLLKYSDVLSKIEAEQLFDTLIDINLSCNQFETKNYLLNCFQSFVQAFGTKSKYSKSQFNWQKFWDIGIKSIALMSQCHSAGHKLLQVLLMHELVVPKNDFLALYTLGCSNRVSHASLKSLEIFLKSFASSISNNNLGLKNSVGHESRILEWLFSKKSEDNAVFQILSDDVDIDVFEVFAEVAASLLLQSNENYECFVKDEMPDHLQWISKMEDELLQLTFNLPVQEFKTPSCKTQLTQSSFSSIKNSAMKEKVLSCFIEATSTLFEEKNYNSQVCFTPIFVKYALLLFEMLQTFYFKGVLKVEDLQSNLFISHFKKVFLAAFELNLKEERKHPGNSIVVLFKRTIERIVSVFKNKRDSLEIEAFDKFIFAVASVIPSDILQLLLSFSLEKISDSVSNSSCAPTELPGENGHGFIRKKNRYAIVDENLDDESETFEPNLKFIDAAGLFDWDSLSENFKQQIQCLEIVGEYCSFITANTAYKVQGSLPEQLLQKLLPLVKEKSQNVKTVYDIHLALSSLKCILLMKYLEDDVVESVLNAVKFLLNQFSGMQNLCSSILNIFPYLHCHIFQSSSSVKQQRNKSRFLFLIKILCQNELEESKSPSISLLVTKNLHSILKVEPTATWPSDDKGLNGSFSDNNTILMSFSKFLNSSYVSVRLYVSTEINHSIPVTSLEAIYEFACCEIFNYLQKQDKHPDDYLNRISTFFHYLSQLMLEFPCFTKESLFMICKVAHTKKVDQELVYKVIMQLSSVFGYDSPRNFIETHLEYIFHRWIMAKYSLLEFPFAILEDVNCNEFLINCYTVIVPILFFNDDMSSISGIADRLKLSTSEIIYASLPKIQARILSFWPQSNLRNKATKAKALLDSVVPVEVSEATFHSKLDLFFISLLSMLKDRETSHLPKCQLTEPYSLTYEDLLGTISYIMSNQEFNGSFIAFLNMQKDRIQNILLSLAIKLCNAVTAHQEGHILFMYLSFIELLAPEINDICNCNIFVIKETVSTIINFMNEKQKKQKKYEACVKNCCDILYCLFKATISNFKETIGEFLPFIVNCLTAFVNEGESGKKVLSLLSFLVIENSDNFYDYIPFLDPFPNNPVFENLTCKYKDIKYKNGSLSLEKEIIIFLKSCQMMGKGTVEGLQHLNEQLKLQQLGLLRMLNSLKEKILFSENVKVCILHQLVCQLTSLCASDDASQKVQKAASNCLGAIGPVAFSSVVLQPSSNVNSNGLNTIQQSYLSVINILIEYLFHKRIDVKKTASEVLKNLLGTTNGYSFFVEYKKHHSTNNILNYASPFVYSQNAKNLKSTSQFAANLEIINNLALWIPLEMDHSEWITTIVCSILESGLTKNNFYECLVPMCRIMPNFCDEILPHIIYAIVSLGDESTQVMISNGINAFFSNFSSWFQGTSFKNGISPSPAADVKFSKQSVRTMLSVLHYLWLNPKQRSNSERNVMKDLWIEISFLEVAQAAQYCSAYFTAILYTELWCNSMREKNRNSESVDHSDSSGSLEFSPLSYIGSQGKDKAHLIYDILLDTYSNIGDSDAISGCEVVAHDSQAILKHSYFVEKNFDGLLKISDMNCANLEVLQALQKSHLNSVLQNCIHSLNSEEIPAQVVEYQSEAAWRMGQWNSPIIESSSHGFQEYFYKSQQNLVVDNISMFENFMDLALQTQFDCLKHTSLEATRNILPVLSHVQMVSVLEDFSKAQSNVDSLKNLLKIWSLQDSMPYDYFEFVEPVSWLKCILLKHLVDVNLDKQLQGRNIIISELKSLLDGYVVRAREERHLEVAAKAINMLRCLPGSDEEEILQWQVEDAKTVWTKKEYSIANKILKSSLKYMEKFAKENSGFVMSYGEALTLRGRWLAETCCENSSVIMRDYLEKAVDVLQEVTNKSDKYNSTLCDAYLAVARFSDAQYQSIINYQKSTAYQTKQELMISSKEKAKELRLSENTEDQRKLQLIFLRQNEIDQTEMKSMEMDKKSFLEKAVIHYLKCLKGSEKHDLWIFRLISLWFQNIESDYINQIIKQNIYNLETYKFLPLMYQLAARMGTQSSGIFQNTLTQLIKNIALDHPHHALPVILALSNADKDPVEKKEVSEQTVYLQQAEVPAVKERMNAAKKVLTSLQRSKISTLLKNYVSLCDAYISLAYLPVDKKVKRGTIPQNQPILKFRKQENIPIITEELKIDRKCEYKNVVGIHSFHSEFRMCGGITLPKVIKCIGTDGVEREQLVKGRDDLRQDAVMQQVFFLVNCLLKQKMETQQRKLHIRTYKVVPVSRRSGVLQWCEGTQVLSQYLIGSNGAHTRYYPTMATPLECRKKMESISSVSQLPKKRQIFDSICASFPPVFRYFFFENFPEPSAWFERRQSYTKSVAASSIVGYILGLGDRHVNNILIDKNTAEVVHIDFGIAFEKGRILATPETVPFRLTRDIVDGMGINGVEGTFKRCSEKTLEVMRNSQDVLLTILEVLLHDPLYEWTVPASKSSQRSNGSSSSQNNQEVNTLAERALMRLQQKLQGLEEGVAMSTEGQVNLLIQQARDPNNLCRLYVGWQPFL
ncbi:serine-protein kinase ATM isoform X1 [Parasteatoda tepidariorum]|nr:serine-protein kinase ATM isoform X1 [Parasteatoda tepidariorum]XP_042907103.1 serine-protein kinase ATM isoform X1 [Parasteatoda tepidariorum]